MAMRTIKSLANELGITERTFHRKIKTGDAKVLLSLRQEVIEENSIFIQSLPGELRDMAEVLERTDKDISRVCNVLADRIEKLYEDTPRSPWRMKMDKRGLEVCENHDEWAKLEAEIAAETDQR